MRAASSLCTFSRKPIYTRALTFVTQVLAAASDVCDGWHVIYSRRFSLLSRNRTRACVPWRSFMHSLRLNPGLTCPLSSPPYAGIAATFAAWLAMLELVVLVQSRAILCDIFLYTFNIATIGASFASQHPSLKERGRLVWCFVTGIMLGCALSVKLTAIGTLAVVGIHQAMSLFREAFMAEKRDISQIFVSAAPAIMWCVCCAFPLYPSPYPRRSSPAQCIQIPHYRLEARSVNFSARICHLLCIVDRTPQHSRLLRTG